MTYAKTVIRVGPTWSDIQQDKPKRSEMCQLVGIFDLKPYRTENFASTRPCAHIARSYRSIEVGFYQDPVSDYGRLSSGLFRAVRLVVDTGIHAKGWSRHQVVEFMRRSRAVDESTIPSETDRYIAWPAQACSYKIGQLKFRELRLRAGKEMGAKFDLRAFHDEMLNGGSMPLELLDARTETWISEQKAALTR